MQPVSGLLDLLLPFGGRTADVAGAALNHEQGLGHGHRDRFGIGDPVVEDGTADLRQFVHQRLQYRHVEHVERAGHLVERFEQRFERHRATVFRIEIGGHQVLRRLDLLAERRRYRLQRLGCRQVARRGNLGDAAGQQEFELERLV